MCPEREVCLEESGQEDPLQGVFFPFGSQTGSYPRSQLVFLKNGASHSVVPRPATSASV